MNREEAVRLANEIVLKHKGVEVEPSWVHLSPLSGGRRQWAVVYLAQLFLPPEVRDGRTIDGGGFAVYIDKKSGEITIRG